MFKYYIMVIFYHASNIDFFFFLNCNYNYYTTGVNIVSTCVTNPIGNAILKKYPANLF